MEKNEYLIGKGEIRSLNEGSIEHFSYALRVVGSTEDSQSVERTETPSVLEQITSEWIQHNKKGIVGLGGG